MWVILCLRCQWCGTSLSHRDKGGHQLLTTSHWVAFASQAKAEIVLIVTWNQQGG